MKLNWILSYSNSFAIAPMAVLWHIWTLTLCTKMQALEIFSTKVQMCQHTGQKMPFSFTNKIAPNFTSILNKNLRSTFYDVCKKDQRKSNGAKEKVSEIEFWQTIFSKKNKLTFLFYFFYRTFSNEWNCEDWKGEENSIKLFLIFFLFEFCFHSKQISTSLWWIFHISTKPFGSILYNSKICTVALEKKGLFRNKLDCF